MMEELIVPENGGYGKPAETRCAALRQPNELKNWGAQAKQRLQPTYVQQHCLDQLEKLLRQQATCF